MSDIENKVMDIVADHLSVDKSKIQASSSFVDDLGADSLDQVELVMALEEEFGIEIPDNVAEKIQKVSDAVDYIKENAKETN